MRWTQEEVNILKDTYGKIPIEEIVKKHLFNKTKQQISNKACSLRISSKYHYVVEWLDENHIRCSCCKEIKDKICFNKHKSKSIKSFCKVCDNIDRREQYTQNLGKHQSNDKKRYLDNRKEWLIFFENHYSKTPQCEICCKTLSWQSNKYNNNSSVCWDHFSEGSLKLKILPSLWLAHHKCNDKNINQWILFNLGILCSACNCGLPTLNRLEWLKKALEYSEGKNGIRL